MNIQRFMICIVCLFALGTSALHAQGIRVLEVDDQPTDPSEISESIDRILAIVEDRPVTYRQYVQEFGDTKIQRDRLQRLIDQALIRVAGRQAGVLLEKPRLKQIVDSRVQQIRQQQGSEAFKRFLAQRNLSEKEFRRELLKQIRDQRLQSEVLVRFFPSVLRPDTRAAQQLVRGRLMIVSDSSTADRVYQKVSDSPVMATWNRLYEKHGQSIPFLGSHGELDWFRWGTYRPEIEYPFFEHDLFRMSQPFRVGNRWGIAIPTGFRYETAEGTTEGTSQAFERYRRRYFTEQLSNSLRERYTVRIPQSVEKMLKNDAS